MPGCGKPLGTAPGPIAEKDGIPGLPEPPELPLELLAAAAAAAAATTTAAVDVTASSISLPKRNKIVTDVDAIKV